MQYREDPPRSHEYHYYRRPHFGFGGGMPPMLKKLIIINVAVFIFQYITATSRVGVGFDNLFALDFTLAVRRGFLWQFVTYAFLHASPMHILFNMLFLWMFGRELEPALGSRRFLVFYLTGAVFSGMLYILFDVGHVLASEGEVGYKGCVGASGAVMAVTMAYALYWPNRLILFMLIFPMRMRTFVFIVALIEMFGVLNIRDNIAHSAHLGGMLWGLIFVRYAFQWEQLLSRLQKPTKESSGRSTADEQRLDRILDKIHREGIQSLSWGEQRFLKRMGKRK